ncbi:hypothetical protein [Corynebacterium kefirresidentii]|uniref:hypothetical protein n=1 Tax=Corynebacterium kefirresidentii TaxID=1979527 RepID=UPI0039AF57B1
MGTANEKPAIALDLNEFLATQGLENEPSTFSDALDVAQSNIASHFRQISSDFVESSSGALRLTGDGVVGNSVSLMAAGNILQNFQAVITSLGASLEGKKSARGKLPKFVVEETQMLLDAAPAPGSVVLNFSPKSNSETLSVAEESQTSLEIEEDDAAADESTPLAERAIGEFINLLKLEDSEDSEWSDLVVSRIDELGPRVANAMSMFSAELGANSIDLDFKWRVPGVSATRLQFDSQRSIQIRQMLESIRVTNHVAVVEGTIQKISSVTPEQIELRLTDKQHGEDFPVDFPNVVAVSVPNEVADVAEFRVREHIGIVVLVDKSVIPGRQPSFSVEAHKVLKPGEITSLELEDLSILLEDEEE